MPHDYAKEPFEKLLRDNPDLRVTVDLTIRLHANGALSVRGPVGDPDLCNWMLDQGRDAVRRQHDKTIMIPGKDVGAPPNPESGAIEHEPPPPPLPRLEPR